MQKTNVMRMLDKAKITYSTAEYEVDESDLSGTHIAEVTGMNPETVFKTLVAKGDKTGHCVFCIPCAMEVDLKKAAKITGNKKVEFLPLKELLPTTGYIRGGCSPIGMKKKFPTFIHESAKDFETISVSGGMRGLQVILSPEILKDFIGASFADLITEA
ncbi:MAG: Cys-tRNA(Pro) deacylase [Clostridia bacterium]|nr:Cys-tRNA(Pro) deacylase [Clostridia bacterium]